MSTHFPTPTEDPSVRYERIYQKMQAAEERLAFWTDRLGSKSWTVQRTRKEIAGYKSALTRIRRTYWGES